MALTPRLELRVEQRLALTPEVRLRLSVLRMTPAELADEVAREAARNPFLIHERRALPAIAAPEFDTLSAPTASFHADLAVQIARMDLPDTIAALARWLIGELRADGFLDVSLDDLSAELGVAMAPLTAALHAVQACEPAGVGARDMAECLCLQLVDLGLSPPEAAATVAQLPGFARHDWRGVGAALGLDPGEVQARAALLRGLSARPIPEDRPEAPPLRPDLRLARAADGTLSVVADVGARPDLALDEGMMRRATREGFAPDLLQRARALLAAIDQRGATLARIGDWLVTMQPAFFAVGPGALVPATRLDLAAALGLHPSTISRALAGKAIDADGRLWPLSVFFSAALPGSDGPVSARAVQRRIAEMIAAEPPGQPLSDDGIAAMLHAQGVDIARRTVAKYRQGLRIPPSSTRRRLATARRGG